MANNIKFEEVINGNVNKLVIDRVYENKKPYKDKSGEVLSKLMGVKNSGGFRPIGKYKSVFDVKYIVIYSTNDDLYWQDKLDIELGMYTYYGDNKHSGTELHETNIGGNLMLKHIFEYSSSEDIEIRKKIPPIFLFEKTKSKDVRFSGLLVPGYRGVNKKEWLTALWAKSSTGGRFQNYKSLFTILDTSLGSINDPKDASINMKWIQDIINSNSYDSIYAPISWKNYIDKRIFTPLTVNILKSIRSKEEQIPNDINKINMLKRIHNYFSSDPTKFEEFAILLTTYADSNIFNCTNTRPTRDGGRDAIGEYKIFEGLSANLTTTFAMEAKCYDLDNSVGVKETSRLISRIKHRQFGILVTTSYVAKQAYEEIIEDDHPIVIISGTDIIEILYQNEITNLNDLDCFLSNNYNIN